MTKDRALDPFPEFTRFGTPDDINSFGYDIENVANKLIRDFEFLNSNKYARTDDGLDKEAVRFVVYTLIVHQARRCKPLTEHHLRMLQAILEVKRKSLAGAAYFHQLKLRKFDEFIAAVDTQITDPGISQRALALAVGVSEKTISKWRSMPEFGRLIRARTQVHSWTDAPDE